MKLNSKHINRKHGQALVEYMGALTIAGLVLSGLAFAMVQGNWMNTAYAAIINAAGNMLLTMASRI